MELFCIFVRKPFSQRRKKTGFFSATMSSLQFGHNLQPFSLPRGWSDSSNPTCEKENEAHWKQLSNQLSSSSFIEFNVSFFWSKAHETWNGWKQFKHPCWFWCWWDEYQWLMHEMSNYYYVLLFTFYTHSLIRIHLLY